jgi:hypothetical protein
MSSERFPVVDERPLLRPERRWFLRSWRDPAQLPTLPPGCVYVFAVEGRYAPWPHTEHPRGTEPQFTQARSVSVVNTRYRRIVATTWVPSRDPADDFLVRAVFGCRVARPDIVAAHGLTGLQTDLDLCLRLEEQLIRLQHRFGVEEMSEARAAVAENLTTAYRQRPPAVPGMYIEFEGVHVCPPRALRDHYAGLRDTIWSWQTETLREAFELERVKHAEELLKSPERADAAALARQEITAKQAADRAFQERDTRTQRLIEQVQKWLDADGAKRAPIDRRYFADALFQQLTGQPAPGAAPAGRVHSNGHADPPADGPLIPPQDRVDGG